MLVDQTCRCRNRRGGELFGGIGLRWSGLVHLALDELILGLWRCERRMLRGVRGEGRRDRISIRGKRMLIEGRGSLEGRRTTFSGGRRVIEMDRFGEDVL